VSVSVIVSWMLIAAGVSLLRRVAASLKTDVLGLIVVIAAIGAWAAMFPIWGWERFNDPPLLHRGLLLALALAAEFWWLTTRLGAGPRPEDRSASADPAWKRPLHELRLVDVSDIARMGGATVPVALCFAASSFEVARVARRLFDDVTVRGAAVSIWWGVFSIGLLIIGFSRKNTLARRAGLALLAVATLKALILDTASVSTGWRALSVLGLGLLMLGVGIVYARLSKIEAGRNGETPDSDLSSVEGEAP
jgi:uncharacterized membrane protein